MAHRGVCPDMACELIKRKLKDFNSKKEAHEFVANELGVPLETVRWWDKERAKKEQGGNPPQQPSETTQDSVEQEWKPNEATEQIFLGQSKKIKTERRKKRERARAEQQTKQQQEQHPLEGKKYQLICDDIGNLGQLLSPESIDAIITDPPYGKDALPLYQALSKIAFFCLKEHGICLVMTGQSHLETILAHLSEFLSYNWTLAYLTPGASVQVFGRKIKSNWKPIIYLTKGQNRWEHVEDIIQVHDSRSKNLHEWQQTENGFYQLIERFTSVGDVILDPFCGSGTTGVAALGLGRLFIGVDSNQAAINSAAKRLMQFDANQK